MIYILGTTHPIQHGDDTETGKDKINEYTRFLESTISRKKISVAAEEASKDSLEYYCVEKTQLKSIIDDKFTKEAITYFYFDPDKNQSKEFGIKRREDLLEEYGITEKNFTHKWWWRVNKEIADYDYLREKVWLEKIRPYLETEILLVCGYGHCESLLRLLGDAGYEARISKIMG